MVATQNFLNGVAVPPHEAASAEPAVRDTASLELYNIVRARLPA
jgi:hypothetical protein